MAVFGYIVVGVGSVLWVVPFLMGIKRGAGAAQTLDRRARWGMILQAVSYSLLWQGNFWARTPGLWRIGVSVAFFVLATALCWAGARALGRQWRLDAGLDPDHELVRSGPYRIVRHPIYTSMLCLLLGTGFIITPIGLIVIATLVFTAGTEIRVRIEDKLLERHFGDRFRDYKRTVPAYVPLF